MRRMLQFTLPAVLVVGLGLGLVSAWGQGHVHSQAPSGSASPQSIRITMDALHAAGGVPPGWRFTLPTGDAAAGRQAFVDFKCYACHAIKGEQFPLKPGETATAGPELTGMGGHHPAEYLAESIVNPSAVLVEGPGYIGGDGRSIMPMYPEMTLAQLANLVTYLKGLNPANAEHAHDAVREQMVAGYRVRLVYKKPEATDHMHHYHPHGSATPKSPAPARLAVFLVDASSGGPIPYVPVNAKIDIGGKPAQTVRLSPSFGREGFYYDAPVTIPADAKRVTLTIGPTTMRLDQGAPEGLKRAQTVAFDWK
jgi:mono/diheme cytochrome c family protein